MKLYESFSKNLSSGVKPKKRKLKESEDKDQINLDNIKEQLKRSGITNERTLDLMSKDVLKTLKTNYEDDCSDDGIYYGVVITDAISSVVERITGTRPKMTFGESCVKKVKPKKRAKKMKEGVLEPKNSSVKSFYGKAFVNDNGDGSRTLISYNTPIMKVKDGQIEMLCDEDDLTTTTIRHIREFMQQEGLDVMPKKQLVKLIQDQGLKEACKVKECNLTEDEKAYAEYLKSNNIKELSKFDQQVIQKDDLVKRYMDNPDDDQLLDQIMQLNKETSQVDSSQEKNYNEYLRKVTESEKFDVVITEKMGGSKIYESDVSRKQANKTIGKLASRGIAAKRVKKGK